MNWIVLVLNIVLIALLGVGIFYAWRLQRAIGAFATQREAMGKFLADFSAAIVRAEKAIRDLQDTAQDAGVDVDRHVARAQGLRDELGFLVDAADRIATRLTDQTNQAQQGARKEASVASTALPVATATKPERGEKIVTETPRRAPGRVEMSAQDGADIPAWAKRVEQDSVVIHKAPLAAMPDPQQTVKPKPAAPREQPRSQAERELLQVLEKMQ